MDVKSMARVALFAMENPANKCRPCRPRGPIAPDLGRGQCAPAGPSQGYLIQTLLAAAFGAICALRWLGRRAARAVSLADVHPAYVLEIARIRPGLSVRRN